MASSAKEGLVLFRLLNHIVAPPSFSHSPIAFFPVFSARLEGSVSARRVQCVCVCHLAERVSGRLLGSKCSLCAVSDRDEKDLERLEEELAAEVAADDDAAAPSGHVCGFCHYFRRDERFLQRVGRKSKHVCPKDARQRCKDHRSCPAAEHKSDVPAAFPVVTLITWRRLGCANTTKAFAWSPKLKQRKKPFDVEARRPTCSRSH